MDVGAWLQGLGLGQYEAAFRQNEIDAEILADLTDHDLEKLGVPLGHRKRLLKAIANLGSGSERRLRFRHPSVPPLTQPNVAKSR